MPHWQKIRMVGFVAVVAAVGVLFLISGGHPQQFLGQLWRP